MSQINFREDGTFPLKEEGSVGDVATGILHQGRRMIGVRYPEGWIYSFLDNDIQTTAKSVILTTKKKPPKFAIKGGDGGGGQSNIGENVGTGSGWYKGMDGANLQFKTAIAGTDTILNSTGDSTATYAPIEIASNTNDLTLSMSSTFVTAFNARIANIVEDATPKLGGMLDCGTNAVAFEYDSDVEAEVDTGVAEIDLRKGNKFFVTIGETCTQFNMDFHSSSYLLGQIYTFSIIFEQDGSGGYQVTNWNEVDDGGAHTVVWQHGTAPVFTTGDDKIDIVTFLVTPSKMYGTFLNNF